MNFDWIAGFTVRVAADGACTVISANREGLLSLANHLRALADEPAGAHIHLDEHNSLDEGSCELVIERIE